MSVRKLSSLGTSTSSTEPSAKRAKTTSTIAASRQIEKITSLESQLRSNPDNLNPIVDIQSILSSSIQTHSTKVVHDALFALHRIFSSLIRQGRLHGRIKGGEEESLKVVKEWLKKAYSKFVDELGPLLAYEGEEDSIRIASLTIFFSLVRTETERLTSLQDPPQHQFASDLFRRFTNFLLLPKSSDGEVKEIEADVKTEFVLKYFNFCDDIRYHFLKESARICESFTSNTTANVPKTAKRRTKVPAAFTSNLLSILESLTTMPTEQAEINEFWTGRPFTASSLRQEDDKKKDKVIGKAKIEREDGSTGIFDDSESEAETKPSKSKASSAKTANGESTPLLLSLPAHRKQFSACWLALLQLELNEEQIKRVLNILHRSVLPHMARAGVLMDWLSDCVDYGGTIALLALNGLFTLMHKYNLDYPHFFRQVYGLLDREVMHVRYRPRFFRLLDVFLSSSHLPSSLIAAFVKRLSRLSLSSPPSAIITIVPFIYNLLKRHPTCMVLIHRDTPLQSAGFEDPYLPSESDPLKSQALESSIWEVTVLRRHYLSSVSTLAKVFEEAFNKPNYGMEDFLDHAYSTLFETEVTRKIKNPPALASLETSNRNFFPLSKTIQGGQQEDGGVDVLVPAGPVGQVWEF